MAETGKNTARRDLLLELQRRAQGKWAREKTFEVDAPKRERGRGRAGKVFWKLSVSVHERDAASRARVLAE